jgi:isocitrate dehydrogenase kinase/phosphatase
VRARRTTGILSKPWARRNIALLDVQRRAGADPLMEKRSWTVALPDRTRQLLDFRGMPTPSSIEIAGTILDGFDKHYRLFRETSAEAKRRWERSDWAGVRAASRARIDMYDQRVLETVTEILERIEGGPPQERLWPEIKRTFIGLLLEHRQPECAETFFNSVTRRVLDKRYYRNDYIFSRPAISTEHLDGTEPTYRCYYPEGNDLRATFRQALDDFGIERPFRHIERDIDCVATAVAVAFPEGWERRPNFQLHVLRSLFFRNKAAYAIGRVVNGSSSWPFVVPLLQDDEGRVFVDTILLDPRNIGRLFSLGRAYFFVDMEVPSAYVDFLSKVVPNKSRAELYTMVGLQKQGKTLFFRDLEHHLKHSTDRFVLAPGTKGMVMVVFTLPSFPYVFKVIRDWFPPPKDIDRAGVEERYRFVKLHDRVGRMSDTLEFAHVEFPRARFDDALLSDLEGLASSNIEVEGDRLVVKHFYIERRLQPLDVVLANVDETRQRAVIDEWGRAVKDLAGANIFPGDLLLKNFGLTRHGRVVFYDYDELCEVTDCHFRTLPKPQTDEDETRAEPWFAVDRHDVFPEQFPTFLFPEGKQRDFFFERHGEIADAAWWRSQQERLRAGIQDDLFAYAQEIRFSNRFPTSGNR